MAPARKRPVHHRRPVAGRLPRRAGHPVVRTPHLDRLAAGGAYVPPPFRAGRAVRAEPGGALHGHVPDEPPVGAQRHPARRPPRQRRPDRPAPRLRARAVRLHRHERRPPHRRAGRRTALPLRGRAARLRSRVPPARGRTVRRGSTGCAPTGWTSPTTGAPSSTVPRPGPSPGRSTTANTPRPVSSPTDSSSGRRSPRRRRRRRGLVRARLVPPAAPAVPRARALRHDVRPRVGPRAGARRVAGRRGRAASRCSA